MKSCTLSTRKSRLIVNCDKHSWYFGTGHGLGRDMRNNFGLWETRTVEVSLNELVEFLSSFYCRRGVATTIRPTPMLWENEHTVKPHLQSGVEMLFTLIEQAGFETNKLCPKLEKLYRKYKRGDIVKPNIMDWIGIS